MLSGFRITIVTLLALFVAGVTMHSVNATEMPLKMAMSDGGSVKMADCQGCGDDDDEKTPSCDIVCMVSFVATLTPPADTARSQDIVMYIRQATDDMTGRTGPPEPFPPRILI